LVSTWTITVNLVAQLRFAAARNSIGFPTGDSHMVIVNARPNPATADATTAISATQRRSRSMCRISARRRIETIAASSSRSRTPPLARGG